MQIVCSINHLLCPPPNVATLGERRRADDFGSHPGVGAGGAHLGGAMPLTSQSKICDLQCLVAEVFHLNPFKDEDWWSGRWWGDFVWRWVGRLENVGQGIRAGWRVGWWRSKRFHVIIVHVVNVGRGGSRRGIRPMTKPNACGNAKKIREDGQTKQGGGRDKKEWMNKSRGKERAETPRNSEQLQQQRWNAPISINADDHADQTLFYLQRSAVTTHAQMGPSNPPPQLIHNALKQSSTSPNHMLPLPNSAPQCQAICSGCAQRRGRVCRLWCASSAPSSAAAHVALMLQRQLPKILNQNMWPKKNPAPV